MQRYCQIIIRLLEDEDGAETLEFAIVSGLIVVAAISLIGKIGTKVAAKWTSLNSSL
jgi:pilus assembly protein Flp/PilA